MTRELVKEVQRRIYNLNKSALTCSQSPEEFCERRGQANAYRQLLSWIEEKSSEILIGDNEQ